MTPNFNVMLNLVEENKHHEHICNMLEMLFLINNRFSSAGAEPVG